MWTVAGTQAAARAEALEAMRGTAAPLADRAIAALCGLAEYCRAHDWAGHDPYDALNSRVFQALPFLDAKLPRLAITQALKRSPIDLRRVLLVPRTQNPKAIGLFLSSFIKAPRTVVPDADIRALEMVDRLVALRAPDEARWCWGYSFPWQTRSIIVPRGAANLVCTTFAASALLDAYRAGAEARCLHIAVDAAEYLLERLYWRDGHVASFSYPDPTVRTPVHNANFLGAALLARVAEATGDARFRSVALEVARYSAAAQHPTGAWAYSEGGTQQWVDNFHTGFNLCALRTIGRALGTDEFEDALRRGYAFYRKSFFREDGAPRYFHDRTYPIDIHSVAQSLITIETLRDLTADDDGLADRVLGWALDRMWDRRGFFYYRVLRFGTIRTSYMRWSQAWMFLALSTLLHELSGAASSRHASPLLDALHG